MPPLEVPILGAEGGVVLTPPPRAASSARDPILGTPLAEHPDVVRRLHYWILRWQVEWSEFFPSYLARMERHVSLVDSLLAERGMPLSLRYLPIVESGYNPRAASGAGAVGIWQFMRGTARFRGLRVTPILDERRDPLRSTEAALDYLAELNERFGGSWFLALAAYNGGPARVRRILRRHAPGVEPSDSLYWALRDELPAETRDFVPKLLAASVVASDPERFGFAVDGSDRPRAAERVKVPDATSLDVLARAAGVSPEELEALNPHLLRGYTPPGVETGVWIPAGAGERFRENYREIPPEERLTYVNHRIRPGETLSHVALRYGVGVSELRAANPRTDPRRLVVGRWLVVPRSPSGRGASAPVRAAASRRESEGEGDRAPAPEEGAVVYRVRHGDTVSGIAQRHGVDTEALLRLNGLERNSVIRPGDQIRLPGAQPGS
ncbi:MAG: transglycosylase SLT domain-containing protein [Gemmatimonadetes bacterium]|nr:transglycosylase SLT domain-containing protein [Gemmatimonadota bacterium]NIR77610.1 transglycosylase SLT domain-containing protein [Gemmatimonadota bacterium]NIT86165.1 transglycosylase SLT domain-containing protein [Gemmatimonadota bacterium]NIU29979.1 transglycosylase SLT domain-containing protein [Gemmatimonadota bacterium]NIU34944.1 transglycosylase SLT domain-containing protein [Gemmatimonadota bacterium]